MSLSNDLPIDLPGEDKFGLDPFATSLANSIAKMQAPAGVVIAVNGEWGSGKSSAINLVKHHLKPQIDADQIEIIPFNPWWFQGGDTLALSFFQQLGVSIGPSLPNELRKSLGLLGQGVSGVGALVGAVANLHAPGVGSIISGATGLFGKLTKQTTSVETEHRRISEALGKQAKRFLVIIDDIDRLNPDDVLTIFRLVKSVGRLPNVIYLLSFDRKTAERIVGERFPSEGASYLDKIIQGSFDIPPPLVDALRQEVVNSASKIMGEPAEPLHVRWWNVFADVVAPTIQTPRDVIRLSNQLSATWPAVAGNVDHADFLAITALQLADPALYGVIRDHPAELCGAAPQGVDRRNLGQVYDDLLGLTGRPERQATQLRIGLRRLFPRLDAVWSNTFHDTERWRRDRLIASKDHFRSYFAFAVSEDVLPAEKIDALIARADDEAFVQAELRAGLATTRRDGSTLGSLMLDELTVYAPQIDAEKVAPLVRSIFAIADDLDVQGDRKRGFSIGDNHLRIHWLLNRLVSDRFDEDQRAEIYRAAMPAATLEWACDFTEHCLAYFEPRGEGRRDLGEPVVSQAVAEEFRAMCLAKIRLAAQDGTLVAHPKLSPLLFAWLRLNGRDEAELRAWTDQKMAEPAFLIAMAAAIPSESWSQGMGWDGMGDRVARRNIRVDLGSYANVLDGERFERRIAEAVDTEEVVGDDAKALKLFRDLPRGSHRSD